MQDLILSDETVAFIRGVLHAPANKPAFFDCKSDVAVSVSPGDPTIDGYQDCVFDLPCLHVNTILIAINGWITRTNCKSLIAVNESRFVCRSMKSSSNENDGFIRKNEILRRSIFAEGNSNRRTLYNTN